MGASLFYVCFRYVLPWCLPFLLALLVAALLEPVVLYLRRKFHFQRGFSALILTLTLLFLLGGLLSLLWSTLLSQTNALLAAAPAFFRICAGSSPRLGGLAGLNNRVTTVNCYAFGSVTANSASNHFGGFIGQAVASMSIPRLETLSPPFLPRKAVGLVFLAAGQYQNTNTRLRRARLGAAH